MSIALCAKLAAIKVKMMQLQSVHARHVAKEKLQKVVPQHHAWIVPRGVTRMKILRQCTLALVVLKVSNMQVQIHHALLVPLEHIKRNLLRMVCLIANIVVPGFTSSIRPRNARNVNRGIIKALVIP